jgi:hypothetical protein
VNCWIFGLAEEVPAQAVIIPDAGPAVMDGDNEFTVMVNVVGVPIQDEEGIRKFPNENGKLPTGMVDITLFVEASIKDISLDAVFTTQTVRPSALMQIPSGSEPTGILEMIVLVAVLITETEAPPVLVTYKCAPSGLIASPVFDWPAEIVVIME